MATPASLLRRDTPTPSPRSASTAHHVMTCVPTSGRRRDDAKTVVKWLDSLLRMTRNRRYAYPKAQSVGFPTERLGRVLLSKG